MPRVAKPPIPVFAPEVYAAFAEYTERDLKEAIEKANAHGEDFEDRLTDVLKLTAQRNAIAGYLATVKLPVKAEEKKPRAPRSDKGKKRGLPKEGGGESKSLFNPTEIEAEEALSTERQRLSQLSENLAISPNDRDLAIEKFTNGQYDNVSAVLTKAPIEVVKSVYQLLAGHVRA